MTRPPRSQPIAGKGDVGATKPPPAVTDRSPASSAQQAAVSAIVDRRRGPFRVQLGVALQRHRLRCGLTQAQLAEYADLSLKYIGEIERGEANTTLDAIERLADVMGWDPLDALAGAREPITEGIRVMLVTEVQQTTERFQTMARWLLALDPNRHPDARLRPAGALPAASSLASGRARSRARPRRKDSDVADE